MDQVTSTLQLAVILGLMCQYASCDDMLRREPHAARQNRQVAREDPLVVKQELHTVREDPLVTSQDPLLGSLIGRLAHIHQHLARATASMGHLVSQLEDVLDICARPTSGRCIRSLEVSTSPEVEGHGPVTRRRRSLRGSRSRSLLQLDNHFRILQDLQRKRDILRRYLTLAHDTNDVIKSETKRSCEVNLGFHCQTEDIEKFSDLYDFVSSAQSPGKRAVLPLTLTSGTDL